MDVNFKYKENIDMFNLPGINMTHAGTSHAALTDLFPQYLNAVSKPVFNHYVSSLFGTNSLINIALTKEGILINSRATLIKNRDSIPQNWEISLGSFNEPLDAFRKDLESQMDTLIREYWKKHNIPPPELDKNYLLSPASRWYASGGL